MKKTKNIIIVSTVVVLGIGALFSSGLGLMGSFYNKENPSLNKPYQQTEIDNAKTNTNTISIGTKVLGRWKGGYRWYMGKITNVSNGTYDLLYEDNDTEAGLGGSQIALFTSGHPNSISAGQKIIVLNTDTGKYWNATSQTASVGDTLDGSKVLYEDDGSPVGHTLSLAANVWLPLGAWETSTAAATATSAPAPIAVSTHQQIINTFKTGLVWDPVKWEDADWGKEICIKVNDIVKPCAHKSQQNLKTGDYAYVYRIRLTEEAKTALAYANDDHFAFRYVYKPHWGTKADQLIQSNITNFKILPGGKLIVINNGNSDIKNDDVFFDGTDIYVKIIVPWSGLTIASDNVEQWGKNDIDIYFYDTLETTNTAKQITISTKYRTETMEKPNIYLQATASGCIGIGDWDFQIVNSGGYLPLLAFERIKLYVSGDGYGPESLYHAFGDARPIIPGHGGRSDWECHDAGNGNLWLVRDTIAGDTTIFHTKVNP